MANTITVWPANETMRKLLRHPNGVGFIQNTDLPTAWPDDSFTSRRLRDGDVLDHAPEAAPEAAPEPEPPEPPEE